MFKFEPMASYVMPAHFGPRKLEPKASGWYRDVTMMIVSFVTDREKLSAYLPEPFEVAELPIVTITYACNKQVDWLAGRGYNLLSVNAAAIYHGKEETMEGNFNLVMWENLTDPILTGRELQGIPKIYADIEEHTKTDGKWKTSARHFGNKFFDMNLAQLREPTTEEVALGEAMRVGKDNPMAWRYMPGISGFGTAISEPTTFPSQTEIKEALVGVGEINWHKQSWQQNPTQYHIINALAELPVLSYLPAVMAKGSANLILPDNMPRVLK